MKTIYKYPIQVITENLVIMPKGADILTVQVQKGIPFIWALVDKEQENQETKIIEVFGTGHDIHELMHRQTRKYIDTFQLHQGELIFHVFEVLE